VRKRRFNYFKVALNPVEIYWRVSTVAKANVVPVSTAVCTNPAKKNAAEHSSVVIGII